MNGDNALLVSVVVFASTTANTNAVTVQQSNDLENWATHTVVTDLNNKGVGFWVGANVTGIASAYVRVKISAAQSSTAVISLSVNTAKL